MEWILPIIRTWLHIFVGIGLVLFVIVGMAIVSKWYNHIMEQVERKNQ